MSAKDYPRLEMRKLSSLKAHPDGVRLTQPADVFRLGKSIKYFNLLRPLTLNVRTDTVLDGDKLIAALRDIHEPDFKVPVWCVDLPAEEEDMAHLALNNHCGEWQWQPVSVLLKAIVERGQDLSLSGFHDYDTGPLIAADWKPDQISTLDGSDPNQKGLF